MRRILMLAAKQKEMCIAHRELIAAHSDWLEAFSGARWTLRHGELALATERLDKAFAHFMQASASFTLPTYESRRRAASRTRALGRLRDSGKHKTELFASG